MDTCRRTIRAFLFFAALIVAAGGIGSSPAGGTALAEPQTPVLTEEQRRKLQERIIEQFEKARDETGRAAPQASQPGQPPSTAPAAPTTIVQRPSIGSDQVQLSYDNADLYDFINQIADILHITPIVIDPEVKGTVTIHSSLPMPKDDVFPLFNLILKNNNAALVRQGNIYMIVPISSALKKGLEIILDLPPPSKTPVAAPPPPAGATPPSTAAPPTRTPATQAPPGPAQLPATPAPPPATTTPPQAPPPQPAPQAPSSVVVSSPGQATAGDPRVPRLATHIIRAEFVPVRDLIEPIKLLMTDGGVIMPYDRLNMLIITDYSDSVSRIIDIIRLLDSSYLDPDLVELIKIKFNASADVLEDLRKIFGSGTKESPTGIYFVSLDRMNAILVMAPSKRALEEVKRWIARLDATTGRTLQTFVYTVENSTAANIAVILSALYGGEGTTTGEATTGRTTGAAGAGRTGAATGGTTGAGGGGFQGAAGSGVSTPFGSFGGGGGGGLFQGGGGGFQQGGGFGSFGGGGGGFFGGGGQQLGPRLNPNAGMSSLALRGGGLTGLQESVRIVVDDINNSLIIQASAADYAYIVEVIKKLDVMPRQVLIDARIFEIELTDTFSFGVSAALQSRGTDPRLTTAKLSSTGGITADTFAFIGNGREILMSLDLLREKTKVRILEAPSILVLDGTEAKIVVGGEVPYPSASFIPATGGSTSSIQYRETGVQLLVIPRISASGIVTLAIAQEVSSVGAPAEDGPTFTKSSVSTTLAVKDGETVAIAGLIRDSNNNARAGIPFLSEIPLIGPLFGKFKRTVNRTELLILITPHVIRTPERFQEMTQDLKDSLRNVRKHVDDQQEEHLKDIEDARKDRYKREEKRLERKGDEPKGDDKRPAIVTPPVKPPKEKKP